MERVSFLIESTGARLSGLLNPETLVVRRWAGIRTRSSGAGQLTGAGLADDPLLATGGGRTELDLDLLFDVTVPEAAGGTRDVRDLTLPLWNLAENTPAGDGATGPAQVRFVWGKSWNFPGVIAAIAERLENFTPEGVARRSWLRLRLLRAGEQLLPAPSATPAWRAPREAVAADLERVPPEDLRVREVAGGQGPGGIERLDTFLDRNQVDPRHWKLVAALNDLADPYSVPPGTALRLPPATPAGGGG
jgi:hypothetical protein